MDILGVLDHPLVLPLRLPQFHPVQDTESIQRISESLIYSTDLAQEHQLSAKPVV